MTTCEGLVCDASDVMRIHFSDTKWFWTYTCFSCLRGMTIESFWFGCGRGSQPQTGVINRNTKQEPLYSWLVISALHHSNPSRAANHYLHLFGTQANEACCFFHLAVSLACLTTISTARLSSITLELKRISWLIWYLNFALNDVITADKLIGVRKARTVCVCVISIIG